MAGKRQRVGVELGDGVRGIGHRGLLMRVEAQLSPARRVMAITRGVRAGKTRSFR
ncbi:hypothetical protein GCM10011587_11440 [Pyruvatibacter mobilis]|nr:hypothetical protein GCM10011587_11440 [Pyruvatibacter mobilis]